MQEGNTKKGRFVEGSPIPVQANANEKAMEVILPSVLTDKYDVEKLTTDGLPPTHNGYKITWVNNFRLKLKAGKTRKSTVKIDYEVQFDKPDLGGLADQRLFIYDGSSVIMVDPADFADLGSGKIAAHLVGDDPAIGWGGK